MTKEEARNLKVGDMVIFYDCVNQETVKEHTFYYEVVEGKEIPADLGLIVGTAQGRVQIDWFSSKHGGTWCSTTTLWTRTNSTRIEKV